MTNIDVQTLVDRQPLGHAQFGIMLLSFAILVVDGFDTYSIAYAAPAIIAEWNVARAAFTPIFTLNVAGLALGAILFGSLAGRLGNRVTLAILLFSFSALTVAKAWAGSIAVLAALQFLSALPMGGGLPIVMAIVADNTPSGPRPALLMVASIGYGLGGSLAGLVAGFMVEWAGWQSLFYIGGGAGFIVGCLATIFMPDSPQWLVRTKKPRARILQGIARLTDVRRLGADTAFTLPAEAVGRPFAELFAPGRAKLTLLLWLGFISSFIVFYFMNSWLPVLLTAIGLPLRQSVLAGALYISGGVIGGLIFMAASRRFSPLTITIALFALSTISIVALGMARGPLLFGLILAAGIGSVGGLNAGNTAATLLYPAPIRASGVGWALGMGRFGSMSGPLLGGLLLQLNWPFDTICWVIAVPAAIGLIAYVLIARLTRTS